MKFWQKQITKNRLTIASALLLALALSGALIFSFNQYKNQIIKEQEEQLLTIAQTVANSISLYLDFYFTDLEFLNTYEEYLLAGQIFLEQGDKEPLQNYLTTHQKFQNKDVSNYFIAKKSDTFSEDHILIQGNKEGNYTSVNHFAGKRMGSRIDILKDQDDQFHLAISIPTLENDFRLFLVINIEQMYEKVASYIKVGENGYLIIKDSTGLILMHPVKKQIGADVIDGRKTLYPNYDLTELEKLIDHQMQGKEGVEIYHSYWWADEVPKRVKKIAAYTPLWFQDNFMIISAVIDYNEIAQPISKAMFTIFFLTIAIMTAFAIILYQLRNSLLARTKVEQENEYLRKLNSKLEELRNCEEQISHDQRLQLIGTLTGGIAHEFNNLLTPIMGYSGMLMAVRAPPKF